MGESKVVPLFPDLQPMVLPCEPPLLWPEPRVLADLACYEDQPPYRVIFEKSNLIAGVLVGTAKGTIEWLKAFLSADVERSVMLVVVVYPACPTREEHLRELNNMQDRFIGQQKKLTIRILPAQRLYGYDFESMTLPPTVIQGIEKDSGKTSLCIGSIGDLGNDDMMLSSFNMAFQPDAGLRDTWRRWFEYLYNSAVPLTEDTSEIPHLVPATGDIEAAKQWEAYEQLCNGQGPLKVREPKVDQKTGEIIADADGRKIEPWDGGNTRLDPLAQRLQKIFSQGFLVSLDETSRLKPLAIPVKAALLGEKSERNVGAVKQKQTFSLEVLEERIAKEVEKCRVVSDAVDLTSYMLSKGIRWIPASAKIFLDKELDERNKNGLKSLLMGLGGAKDVADFITQKKDSMIKDLNNMYKELGKGGCVPEDKVAQILEEVHKRLESALTTRITPVAVYNGIALPDLTASAPNSNWSQPYSLLLRSAMFFRESITDGYFLRRFSNMSFGQSELIAAMNVFDDTILAKPDAVRARNELEMLKYIEEYEDGLYEKCTAIWQIISATP